MNKQLLLIDGSSMLVTAFHGNSSVAYRKTGNPDLLLQNSSGLFTNGVLIMTKILLSIMRNVNPSHIAVCWDVNRNTLKRRDVSSEYKANRKPTKPELSQQFHTMQRVLSCMNIPQFSSEGVEADDIVGTLAYNFENDIETRILSKDKDVLQLITDKTKVWLVTDKNKLKAKSAELKGKRLTSIKNTLEYDFNSFKEEYGFDPINLIDLKALEGDKSDNIPGVTGVGAKTANQLIKGFGSVENIYDKIIYTPEDELKKLLKEEHNINRSPIKNLKDYRFACFTSKALATIDKYIPEYDHLSLEELKLNYSFFGANSIFNELEFHSLINK